MDSEDDICVLPYSDDELDVDGVFNPAIPFTPFAAPATPAAGNVDASCHYALEKAYNTVKQKLSESKSKNQQLARRVRELELSASGNTKPPQPEVSPSVNTKLPQPSSFVEESCPSRTEELESVSLRTRELDSFVTIGESFDMMEDARYIAVENLAEGGGRPMTQGELEARLTQYRDMVSQKNQKLNALSLQVAQLQEEKHRLQQGWELERGEKEKARREVKELMEKCLSLQQERDKALKEGASLHASLKKASVEMAMLKEKQAEGGSPTDPPSEMISELAHMRRVIDKLKVMVIMQKNCLVNQSMSMSRDSLSRSPADTAAACVVSSTEPPHSSPSPSHHVGAGGGGGGGVSSESHSGHSWEMVNGVTSQPASTTDIRQQQLQQRSAKMIPVELSPRRDSSMKSSQSGHPSRNAGKPVAGDNHQNGAIMMNIQNGPTSDNNLNKQKPKTDAIHRRNSENVIHRAQEVRREAPAPRAHTLPQQTQRGGLAQWMGNHYHQQQQVGLNQFMKDEASPRLQPAEPATQRMGSPSGLPAQMVGVHYPPSSNPYPETQRQPSPISQLSSTYDNMNMGLSSTPVSNQGSTGPSMHILNQSSMTGGRVLQNTSGNFGGGGMTSNPQIAVSVGRDGTGGGSGGGGGSVFRSSPQEHSEVPPAAQSSIPRPRNPTDLELVTQTVQFIQQPRAGGNLDRKCPVCGQDFSHISMDDFQNHVFECFDDDDVSNTPETLHAPGQLGRGGGGGQGGQGSNTVDRVCPMCQTRFALNVVSQEFFERHVQSHFEEVMDHFEVLERA